MPRLRPCRPRRPLAAVVGLALATPLLLLTPAASAAPVVPAKPYDFNGDGFPELAIGAPGLAVDGQQEGGVVVLPASKKGLSLAEQVISKNTPGVGTSADGSILASADFNRDGYADLAVGAPVTILYGSARGLTGTGSYDLGEQSEDTDVLEVGDFDGDGYPDLAAGMPRVDGSTQVPGSVRVYRGGTQGFAVARSTLLAGDRQQPAAARDFGNALGVGDLNDDGVADLVVGAPGAEGFDDGDEGFQNPGSVSICYGASSTGLTSCPRVVDGFTYAGSGPIRVGNVSGGLRPEIVLGIPYPELITDPSGVYDETRTGGALEILTVVGQGSTATAEVTEVTQDSEGVRGTDESFDGFGAALALGDLDHDGYADLVVGAPGEDVGAKRDAGRVTVVYGARSGYRTVDGKVYDQGTKGVPGAPEKSDGFGYAVSLLDHDADGHLDLAVGTPFEDRSVSKDRVTNLPGAVTTLPGSGPSFTGKKSRTFTLTTLKYAEAKGSEFFGYVLGG